MKSKVEMNLVGIESESIGVDSGFALSFKVA